MSTLPTHPRGAPYTNYTSVLTAALRDGFTYIATPTHGWRELNTYAMNVPPSLTEIYAQGWEFNYSKERMTISANRWSKDAFSPNPLTIVYRLSKAEPQAMDGAANAALYEIQARLRLLERHRQQSLLMPRADPVEERNRLLEDASVQASINELHWVIRLLKGGALRRKTEEEEALAQLEQIFANL